MGTRGIAFFDIDGTLVPSMSSSSFLAKRFGHARALDAAEQRYAEGELTNEEVSVIDAEGWRGTPTSTVAAWLEELPLIAGIDAVVAWCVEHDVEPVLASLAWQPVAEAIANRHGLTANGGPRVRVVGMTTTAPWRNTSMSTTSETAPPIRGGARCLDRSLLRHRR